MIGLSLAVAIAVASSIDPFLLKYPTYVYTLHNAHKSKNNNDKAAIMSNQAAWIPSAKSKLQVKEAPMPKAGKGEVVIKNHAVAVNPVDCELLYR